MFDKCKECIHNEELFDSACNHCCEEGPDVSNFESKYDGKDITIDDITTEEKLLLLKNLKRYINAEISMGS